MNTNTLEKFVRSLEGYHTSTEKQCENVSKLIRISRKFHKKSRIPFHENFIESDRATILESGHQPNFLPHAGTWKKAFLLADVQKKLMTNGNSAIAFFGFPDQNLSTARLLSRNQIPALNKKGVEAIGFRIQDSDRLKAFCAVQKPSPESWQQEIMRLGKFYADISNKFPTRRNQCKGPVGSDC